MAEDLSLLHPKHRGGVDGAKGFFFQDAYIASRIPDWLADPRFVALLKEGVGDVEVAFEASSVRTRILYQVKDHHVPPADCVAIIKSFYEKDQAAPGTYHQFVLACRSFGQEAERLRQSLTGLVGASPMYDAHDRPLADTTRDLAEQLTRLQLNVPIEFLTEKVRFDTELGDVQTSDQRLADQFVGAVQRCLPEWAGHAGLHRAYESLRNRIQEAIRVTLSRSEIEQRIQQTLDQFPARARSEGIVVRLYHWEDPPFDPAQSCDVLLDWAAYFDRKTRRVAPPKVWRDKLLPDLQEAQEQIRRSTDVRLIRLYPHACLSAGMAVGWAFSEVKGYTLMITQRTELWRSDVVPAARTLKVAGTSEGELASRALYVTLSVIADVIPKVDQFVARTHAAFRVRLSLVPDTGPGTILDGPTALAFAHQAKQQIRLAVDRFQIDTIHLFYAGPLGLAVFLGRLLNAMHAEVQCYEEELAGDYTPSCHLSVN